MRRLATFTSSAACFLLAVCSSVPIVDDELSEIGGELGQELKALVVKALAEGLSMAIRLILDAI